MRYTSNSGSTSKGGLRWQSQSSSGRSKRKPRRQAGFRASTPTQTGGRTAPPFTRTVTPVTPLPSVKKPGAVATGSVQKPTALTEKAVEKDILARYTNKVRQVRAKRKRPMLPGRSVTTR